MSNPWKSITRGTRVVEGVERRVLIAEDRLGFRTVRYGGTPWEEPKRAEEENESGLHPASSGR